MKVRRTERGRPVRFPVKSFAKPEDAVKYAESTRPENRKEGGIGQVLVKSSTNDGIHTVGDLYEYCRAHTWKNLSRVRASAKEGRWKNHIEPYWGEWPLQTVRRRHAQEWVTEMEAKLQGEKGLSQLKECRIDLGGYFKTAIDMEFFEMLNPFENLQSIAPSMRARTTMESQDFANVMFVLDCLVERGLLVRWIADMFTIGMLTGMRHGEVMALRGKRIDLEKKAVLVDRALRRHARHVDEDGVPYGDVVPQALSYPKRGTQAEPRYRWVAVPDQLLPIMKRLKENGDGLVFGTADGKLKQAANFRIAWTTLCSRMTLVAKGEKTDNKDLNSVITLAKQRKIHLPNVWDKIVFRDTRNSFASYAAEVGIPEPTRMGLMGHTGDTVTFKSYTDITTQAFKDAQRRLSGGWKL